MKLNKEQRKILVEELLMVQNERAWMIKKIKENKTPTMNFKYFTQIKLILLYNKIELIKQALINNELINNEL